ncbi:MAG: aminotransferase class V-fold PLP-dependent enzyme [Nocardioides sp.]|uniref:aminotransferase class V-fold PLP-dependent enzyme n=1 Tax=Nocardioides sp. TaxID=35761 RepID=UPI0039E54303
MDDTMLARFGLDPATVHLNHGAFGVAPVRVRRRAADLRERVERNPHRFHRVELARLVAEARERAADFLGIDPGSTGWVRNVSEGTSAVLGSLDLSAGDELVIGNHGYGAVRLALAHHARRRGARVVEATFSVGASEAEIVASYAAATGPRTRLVVVDQITSPSAMVLPVERIADAVRAAGPAALRVLVDAAHVPGHLDLTTLGGGVGIAELGADHWVGNLHKWAYTPRGSAVLWSRPGREIVPTVLSWNLTDGYAAAFDHPGTSDYAGWLTVPEGLDFWAELGGWAEVRRLGALVAEGQLLLAQALGTSTEGLPDSPAPAMRLVRLPDGVLAETAQVGPLYERISAAGVEVPPVLLDGVGHLRIAAAPYNTVEDYRRLAQVLGAILTEPVPAAG